MFSVRTIRTFRTFGRRPAPDFGAAQPRFGRRPTYTLVADERIRWSPSSVYILVVQYVLRARLTVRARLAVYAGRRPAYTLVAAERVRWSPSSVYAGRRRAYTLVAVRQLQLYIYHNNTIENDLRSPGRRKNDFNKSFCSKSFENCRLYSVLRRASCIIGQLNQTYT